MTGELKYIIESLLFVSKEPLTIERMKMVLEVEDTKEIRDALNSLSDEYEARKGGFFLCEVAGGYQLRTRPDYKEWIKRLLQPGPVRLSRAAMETLAIIAYKQPIIRSDVERIRGVDCGGVLRMLMERKLIRVLGRKEIPGRPLIYATTRQFLEVFNLKDLKALPTPAEIEELGNTPENTDRQLSLKNASASASDDKDGIPLADSEDAELDETDAMSLSPEGLENAESEDGETSAPDMQGFPESESDETSLTPEDSETSEPDKADTIQISENPQEFPESDETDRMPLTPGDSETSEPDTILENTQELSESEVEAETESDEADTSSLSLDNSEAFEPDERDILQPSENK